jgi:KDO2-lipid IV(A) lauroyltransferase
MGGEAKRDTPGNRVRWRVEFAAVKTLAFLLALMPHPLRLHLGLALGRLAFRVDRRHRRVALANLRAAYPDAAAVWHRRTARQSFQHLGRLLVEILAQDRLLPRLSELLELQGVHHLRRIAGSGRGYFLLSGHFGSWEWVALHQATLGCPLWMITRPLDNPHLEELLAARRRATGNRVVHKRNAVREMVKAIKHGHGVAMVIDQDFLSPGAHFVPFFGRLAATTPTLGTLACRLGVPVLPVFSYPLPGGRYRVEYEEPIVPPTGGDQEAAARLVTLQATARIEAAIRRHPSAWFWMHNRWRTRPPEELEAANPGPT